MACGTDVILLFVVLYLYDVTLRIESPDRPRVLTPRVPLPRPWPRRAVAVPS